MGIQKVKDHTLKKKFKCGFHSYFISKTWKFCKIIVYIPKENDLSVTP